MQHAPSLDSERCSPFHGILFAGLLFVSMEIPPLRSWPWLWIGPLAAYSLLALTFPSLRHTRPKLRIGHFTTLGCAATVVIAAGACGTLVWFQRTMQPDVSGYRAFLPISSLGGVVSAGILFSLLNATLEEIVFRGILFESIASEWKQFVAVLATSFLFGCAHMHGYPSGLIGMVLALLFGLCLGWLRILTQGLALPIVAHVAADATIFTLLVRSGAL